MKKRRSIFIVALILVAVAVGALVWWNYPVAITSVPPVEVVEIHFLLFEEGGDGGPAITVTETADIKHIIENFNSVPVKKERSALGNPLAGISAIIEKTDGSTMDIIIYSSSSVRKDLFFYIDASGSIDIDFILDMFNKYPNRKVME